MKTTNTFVFSTFAEKKFRRMERIAQEHVRLKLRGLRNHEHVDSVLKRLTNFDPATHRLRVGQYRLILQRISDHEFLVLDIGNRSEIYR